MSNFWMRIISGAGLIAVTITLFYLGSLGLLVFATLIAIGGNYEWFKLRKMRFNWGWKVSSANALLTLLLVHFSAFNWAFYSSLALLLYIIYLAKNHPRSAISLLGAQLYLTLPLSLLLTLPYCNFNFEYQNADQVFNFLIPTYLMILVWSSDSWAYVSGKLFGKNKLAPSISPGKTWEGFVGGTVLTGATAFLLQKYLLHPHGGFVSDGTCHLLFDPSKAVIIGILVSVFGTLGDLYESSLKRKVNVKDSGNVIPGHGGVLDRYDAFLFAIVVFTIVYRFL
jgi:phosphatidate cytidylyltransferase